MDNRRNSIIPRPEPKLSKGITERVTTGCGYVYITVNRDEFGPCGVRAELGKAGGCASAMLQAINNLITASLLAGVSFESIIKSLRAIRCPSPVWEESRSILSCADAIATVLEKHPNIEN